jgi:hypothetical protein
VGAGVTERSATPPPPGSVAEEAALLAEALKDWVVAHRDHTAADGAADGAADSGPGQRPAAAPGEAPECAYCPFCRLVSTFGLGRPDVTGHLIDAFTSVVAAVRAGLAHPERPAGSGDTAGRERAGRPPVQRIDVS